MHGSDSNQGTDTTTLTSVFLDLWDFFGRTKICMFNLFQQSQLYNSCQFYEERRLVIIFTCLIPSLLLDYHYLTMDSYLHKQNVLKVSTALRVIQCFNDFPNFTIEIFNLYHRKLQITERIQFNVFSVFI